MKKLFNVLMTFLRIGQSETVLGHVFASLRSFMHKFPSVLFHGSANVCGVLCYEVSLHLHERMNFLFLILHYSFCLISRLWQCMRGLVLQFILSFVILLHKGNISLITLITNGWKLVQQIFIRLNTLKSF